MAYYEHRLPCDATQIGRFRSDLSEEGLELLLKARGPAQRSRQHSKAGKHGPGTANQRRQNMSDDEGNFLSNVRSSRGSSRFSRHQAMSCR